MAVRSCSCLHGILHKVDDHPFDLDKTVFMDWRHSHLGNKPSPCLFGNSRFPTCLNAILIPNQYFLKKLCYRPHVFYMELNRKKDDFKGACLVTHFTIMLWNLLDDG
ncbi:Capsanthin/capsorubin synthase, chromoplast [Spatholobus suberectus]|nr:Capsanthin/capsorubin synthase, chromoplast [Spatholobus suberectus]